LGAGAPDVNKAADRLVAVFMRGLISITLFSSVVNVLLLVQPLYMLQVYDRVLASSSVETLLFMSVIAGGALLLLGCIDAIRSMLSSRLAARMEVVAGSDALLASINGPRASLGDVQPLRDLGAVKGFVGGRAILAYLDLPFAPLFIGLLYLIHPHLFWLTVGGAVVLAILALANQWATRRYSADAGEHTMRAMLSAQAFARCAESINAMGMTGNVIGAWGRDEARALASQDRSNQFNASFAGLSRIIRLGLQIAVLGYGGYLVIAGEMTAGMIFAASLISGRGLQPIDQVIAGWPTFVDCRRAWKRLKIALDRNPPARRTTELPDPKGRLELDDLTVFPPNVLGGEPLLKRISAKIAAGESVAVVGPSGAGKSTLVRTIVGGIQPRHGSVRVDGADIRHWDGERLGRCFGYLAQDVDLLPGTIAQNIARFAPDAADADIVKAAKKAEVHELIQRFPLGYDTLIGPAGQPVSGGQRQRIGLARAFFGDPALLILDEPNANLDTDGDLALEKALAKAKEDGVTVLIVTQRRQIAEKADKILMLRDGAIEDFGPRLEVFGRLAQKAKAAHQAKAALIPLRPAPTMTAERFGGAGTG
jgi:ATP-binding cassette subfamily C protein